MQAKGQYRQIGILMRLHFLEVANDSGAAQAAR